MKRILIIAFTACIFCFCITGCNKNASKDGETDDAHTYYIRDYVGRNCASFGRDYLYYRVDEYGNGEIRLVFKTEDGTFVDFENVNILKKYVVTEQNIAPKTELKYTYETDAQGRESIFPSWQNIEEIILTVKPIE